MCVYIYTHMCVYVHMCVYICMHSYAHKPQIVIFYLTQK